MTLYDYAKTELELAGYHLKDSDYAGEIYANMLELIKLFESQGHSGFSAELVIALFTRIVRFNPITPLTGKADEWNDCGIPNVYQNKRCPHVFKENDIAYDYHGKLFKHADGTCTQTSESKVAITFPYSPKVEYVVVNDEGEIG